MNVREMLERLLSHIFDGRGAEDEVLIEYDGDQRTIESVETRLIRDGDERPKDTFVLIIANGPSDILEPSPTTLRPQRG